MTTISLDTSIYREGRDHSVELLFEHLTHTEKTTLVSAVQNAGKLREIRSPLTDTTHIDTTTNDSNTVTFTIDNNPEGISSSITLIIESYSVEIISPEPAYTIRVRGFTE